MCLPPQKEQGLLCPLVLLVAPSGSFLDTVEGEPVPIVLAGAIVSADHSINCLDNVIDIVLVWHLSQLFNDVFRDTFV